MTANLLFAWCWIFLGLLTGAAQGLFFHREDWLGGYGSWQRRIMRLGHVAFFGTGLLNLFAAISAKLWFPAESGPLQNSASGLLIAGAVTMSTICYLSAWRKNCRKLFFIPVACLIAGVGCVILILFHQAG
jgi:ABC-type sugar transport system permease subunit